MPNTSRPGLLHRVLRAFVGLDRDFWHISPIDTLFLHRKLGGLYLLAARLKARVDVRQLFDGPLGAQANVRGGWLGPRAVSAIRLD